MGDNKKPTWETTRVQNLVRYAPSGTYFARFRVQGKLLWKSLDTTVFSVAQQRLPGDRYADFSAVWRLLQASRAGTSDTKGEECVWEQWKREGEAQRERVRAGRYVIAGGEAVTFHGHPRLTGDIDFFYDRESTNASALYDCLSAFWDGNIPAIERPEELMEPGLILQYGRPPHRIDLMSGCPGPLSTQLLISRFPLGYPLALSVNPIDHCVN